jgi:hypothetical protein
MFVANLYPDRQRNRDARVFAFRRSLARAQQSLQNEITLSGFFGRKTDQRPSPDAQPG